MSTILVQQILRYELTIRKIDLCDSMGCGLVKRTSKLRWEGAREGEGGGGGADLAWFESQHTIAPILVHSLRYRMARCTTAASNKATSL